MRCLAGREHEGFPETHLGPPIPRGATSGNLFQERDGLPETLGDDPHMTSPVSLEGYPKSRLEH